MSELNLSMARTIRWLASRVAIIYIILFVFCLTCVDLKTLNTRIKIRHLNDNIPNFSDMIIFSKDQNAKKDIDWKPYKNYFELILRYMPDDVITKQLLAYADYYSGQEQKAIGLFKSSANIKGQILFWSNYNLGVIYYKKGMWPQAAEYMFRTIASNPKLTVLLMQNSIVYRQIFISPFFKYSLSDEIYDAQAKAYILLLSSLNYMGQYDKMFLISNIGLANQNLSHKDAFYYYAGLACFEEGQKEKAFLLFQKSLTLEKDNPDVYYYIADIYQNAGQLEQAQYSLQASYALHQRNDPRFPYDKQVNLCFF
jgi:tetratricopeptide (TPR) repeat protein